MLAYRVQSFLDDDDGGSVSAEKKIKLNVCMCVHIIGNHCQVQVVSWQRQKSCASDENGDDGGDDYDMMGYTLHVSQAIFLHEGSFVTN